MPLELYNPFEDLEYLKRHNPEQYAAAKKRIDEVMPKVVKGMEKMLKVIIEQEEENKKREKSDGS